MKITRSLSGVALSAALLGVGFSSAIAEEEKAHTDGLD